MACWTAIEKRSSHARPARCRGQILSRQVRRERHSSLDPLTHLAERASAPSSEFAHVDEHRLSTAVARRAHLAIADALLGHRRLP